MPNPPLGLPGNQPKIDAGTGSRTQSPTPGPAGLAPQATPVDGDRPLTVGETAMARLVFFNAVNYASVLVHNGGYFPFGLQDEDTAVTPNGEMYFPSRHFREDFSTGTGPDKHWFMHEMVHVWQYQLGYAVRLRGALRLGLSYRYTLNDTDVLGDYNMEAQGDILADYFALKVLRDRSLVRNRVGTGGSQVYTLDAYERTLRDFIADPSNRSNLP